MEFAVFIGKHYLSFVVNLIVLLIILAWELVVLILRFGLDDELNLSLLYVILIFGPG
jgi:hypothetical protein